MLTLNGYSAADYLIIPMSADILSLVGLTQLRETYETIRKTVNPDLKVMGILMTSFDGRRGLSWEVKEMADGVAAQLGTKVFDTVIRSSVAVAEARPMAKTSSNMRRALTQQGITKPLSKRCCA